MRKIAVFISGEGSNASKMLINFSERDGIEVALVYSSRPNRTLKSCAKTLTSSNIVHGMILENQIAQLCKMNID